MTTTAQNKSDNSVIEPLVDVYEIDQTMHILADLPGVSNDNLNVHVEGKTLTIEGVLSIATADGDGKGFEEVRSPYYFRALQLSDDLDGDHINAQFSDGVLRLKIAKKPQSQPKKIAINFG